MSILSKLETSLMYGLFIYIFSSSILRVSITRVGLVIQQRHTVASEGEDRAVAVAAFLALPGAAAISIGTAVPIPDASVPLGIEHHVGINVVASASRRPLSERHVLRHRRADIDANPPNMAVNLTRKGGRQWGVTHAFPRALAGKLPLRYASFVLPALRIMSITIPTPSSSRRSEVPSKLFRCMYSAAFTVTSLFGATRLSCLHSRLINAARFSITSAASSMQSRGLLFSALSFLSCSTSVISFSVVVCCITRQSSGTASPPLISALGGFSYFQHRIGNPICVHCNPGRPVLLYAGLVLPPVLEYSMENSGYNLRCKIIAQQHPFLRRVARLDVCVHLIHAAGKCCGVVWFAGHFMSPSVGTPPNNSLNPTPLRVHGEITRSRRRGLAQPVTFNAPFSHRILNSSPRD